MELDDEFAMVLERRTTNSAPDEDSSGRTKSKRRPGAGSRKSTGTLSSRSTRTRNSKRFSRTDSSKSISHSEVIDTAVNVVPSMTELKLEEAQAQMAEEADVARRREAAEKLASDRGLNMNGPREVRNGLSFWNVADANVKCSCLRRTYRHKAQANHRHLLPTYKVLFLRQERRATHRISSQNHRLPWRQQTQTT